MIEKCHNFVVNRKLSTRQPNIIEENPRYTDIFQKIDDFIGGLSEEARVCPLPERTTSALTLLEGNILKKLVLLMLNAVMQRAKERLEAKAKDEIEREAPVEDDCELFDKINNLLNIQYRNLTEDQCHKMIDELHTMAHGFDGKPFGNWSVRDISGTLRAGNNQFIPEIINGVYDTSI